MEEREPLKVILLSGLRASGKSLCGRALKLLFEDQELCCDYLDLDEVEEKTPLKFELFYKRCLQTMSAKGGIWILDKLGPYGDEVRMKFLAEIKRMATKSIVLQFVHEVEIEELRICFFRFHRRGNNHRDLLSTDEDTFINLKYEQSQRRVLSKSEVACLTDVKNVKINATPYDMLYQAICHLDAASFIDKTRIGWPVAPVLKETLMASLMEEQEIGNEAITLDDIMKDDIDTIRLQLAPYEPGSPDRWWMATVRANWGKFLSKLGFGNDGEAEIFVEVVEHDVPVENLYELFCSICEDTVLCFHRNALFEWLIDDRIGGRAHLYLLLDRNAVEAFTKYCGCLNHPGRLKEVGFKHHAIDKQVVATERGNEVGVPAGFGMLDYDAQEIKEALRRSMEEF